MMSGRLLRAASWSTPYECSIRTLSLSRAQVPHRQLSLAGDAQDAFPAGQKHEPSRAVGPLGQDTFGLGGAQVPQNQARSRSHGVGAIGREERPADGAHGLEFADEPAAVDLAES